MKKISISLLVGLCFASVVIAPQSIFASDFFENQVLQIAGKEATREVLKDIQISNVVLKSSAEKLRLAQTKFFLAQTKKEITNRYAEGTISNYEFDDMKHELSYLSFSMNQYFLNIRAYERSKNRDFQALARQNLKDANQSYARLKAVTLKSARNN
ncbi:MAG: hypothetical protein PHU93_00100 [Candidatus Gracilibacteria bacterium]|nr:hypothetical protein [Candidatus Gracilibacteria bacterium]